MSCPFAGQPIIMMLESKGILTPMIPDCSALRAPAICILLYNEICFCNARAYSVDSSAIICYFIEMDVLVNSRSFVLE